MTRQATLCATRTEPSTIGTRWSVPACIIENGHVAAITLASIDIPKEEDRGNEPHGSKVIVIPFDGVTFDADMAKRTKETPAASPAPGQ